MGLFGPGWGWLAGGGWLGRLGVAAGAERAGLSSLAVERPVTVWPAVPSLGAAANGRAIGSSRARVSRGSRWAAIFMPDQSC